MNHDVRSWLIRAAQYSTLVAAMGCTTMFVSNDEETNKKHAAGKSIAFVENKTYQSECTSCHVGFLPGFLPERSWSKLMSDLENHFGENASLDDGPRGAILAYLKLNAADHPGASPRSKKIAKMISASDAPLRITETTFWKRKHSSIKAFVWDRPKVGSKAKCDTCHHDAGKGIFDDHDVHIPK